MFKVKRLIEKRGTSYLNQVLWSPQQTIHHRLFLSIRSKNSSAEHIHNLPTCLTLINTLTHIDNHILTYDSFTHTHARAHTHTLMHTETCIKMWICSAEEFLELYGKVEAVVRNFLLRWSGHLVEVAGTPLFDQSFCFKQISLFCAQIEAFFCWYTPFPC